MRDPEGSEGSLHEEVQVRLYRSGGMEVTGRGYGSSRGWDSPEGMGISRLGGKGQKGMSRVKEACYFPDETEKAGTIEEGIGFSGRNGEG